MGVAGYSYDPFGNLIGGPSPLTPPGGGGTPGSTPWNQIGPAGGAGPYQWNAAPGMNTGKNPFAINAPANFDWYNGQQAGLGNTVKQWIDIWNSFADPTKAFDWASKQYGAPGLSGGYSPMMYLDNLFQSQQNPAYQGLAGYSGSLADKFDMYKSMMNYAGNFGTSAGALDWSSVPGAYGTFYQNAGTQNGVPVANLTPYNAVQQWNKVQGAGGGGGPGTGGGPTAPTGTGTGPMPTLHQQTPYTPPPGGVGVGPVGSPRRFINNNTTYNAAGIGAGTANTLGLNNNKQQSGGYHINPMQFWKQ